MAYAKKLVNAISTASKITPIVRLMTLMCPVALASPLWINTTPVMNKNTTTQNVSSLVPHRGHNVCSFPDLFFVLICFLSHASVISLPMKAETSYSCAVQTRAKMIGFINVRSLFGFAAYIELKYINIKYLNGQFN